LQQVCEKIAAETKDEVRGRGCESTRFAMRRIRPTLRLKHNSFTPPQARVFRHTRHQFSSAARQWR
jgi:hypothetical protein